METVKPPLDLLLLPVLSAYFQVKKRMHVCLDGRNHSFHTRHYPPKDDDRPLKLYTTVCLSVSVWPLWTKTGQIKVCANFHPVLGQIRLLLNRGHSLTPRHRPGGTICARKSRLDVRTATQNANYLRPRPRKCSRQRLGKHNETTGNINERCRPERRDGENKTNTKRGLRQPTIQQTVDVNQLANISTIATGQTQVYYIHWHHHQNSRR